MSKALLASIAALSTLSLAVLWLTDIPLGIPGEWIWNRIDYQDDSTTVLLGLAQTAIVGVVYLAVVWLGLRRITHCRRVEGAAWLCGLTLAGFAWLVAVQEGTRLEFRLSKAPFVLYYPAASGYFHSARYDIESVPKLLSSYEERMEQGDVLHEGTHPPGLFVLYRLLITGTEANPALTSLAQATTPDSFQDALDTINYAHQSSGNPEARLLSDDNHAVLWLATVLTILSAAAASVPLFALIRQTETRTTAWRIAAMWPLIPTIAIFVPKSDVLFLFPAALLVMTWMLAVRRQSTWVGALAGLIGWCCLFLSLVFLPIGLVAFLAGWFTAVPDDRTSLKAGLTQAAWRISRPTVAGAVAFIVATTVISLSAEMNLLKVWWLNVQNHGAFYDQYTRTVGLWLLVNPLELAVAVGAPLACMAAAAAVTSIRQSDTSRPIAIAVVLVWGLLWISGRNSGEVARLWIPLLPVLAWLAASSAKTLESESEDRANKRWLALLMVQMGVCAATVLRVGGFHFSGITD